MPYFVESYLSLLLLHWIQFDFWVKFTLVKADRIHSSPPKQLLPTSQLLILASPLWLILLYSLLICAVAPL